MTIPWKRTLILDSHGDPVNYKDAMATDDVDKWIPSMEDKMKSLRKHKVWELVDLPKGCVPIKNW